MKVSPLMLQKENIPISLWRADRSVSAVLTRNGIQPGSDVSAVAPSSALAVLSVQL